MIDATWTEGGKGEKGKEGEKEEGRWEGGKKERGKKREKRGRRKKEIVAKKSPRGLKRNQFLMLCHNTHKEWFK